MKKVMCFGAFDIIHPGHLSFIRHAKKQGEHLIVVLARDKTIEKIKKRKPEYSEDERISKIASLNIVDEVVLGDLKDKHKIIRDKKPDIICLGYDQDSFVEGLEDIMCKVVRLKAYKEHRYKSSKLRKKAT